MKLFVKFIGNTWYNKIVEVPDVYITKLCGQSAMNMLFEQDEDDQHKSNNYIVAAYRNDMKLLPFTVDSSTSVSAFASDVFDWICIDKEDILSVLNETK